MAKHITEASFVISSPNVLGCPKPDKPEYAFIGRSNVGKSSLINMITGKPNLAKTSQTPGKTQLINHFLIDQKWYLVDLPGYGYARVSKSDREKFEDMIHRYLFTRPNLLCTFVLIDVRHEPQKIDLAFMQQLGEQALPFCIIFTKADKLSNAQLQKSLEVYQLKMLETWEEMPHFFISSSSNGLGKDDINKYIHSLHGLFKA